MVFLVNEHLLPSDSIVDKLELKIKKSLLMIFDNHINIQGDKLSLMTFGKNSKCLFNLTSINKNNTQLRN